MKTQNVPPVFLLQFISFLEKHGYEIKKPDPRFRVSGFDPNVDLQFVVNHFKAATAKAIFDPGTVSDGYHTFNELYQHRYLLYIAWCKEIQQQWKRTELSRVLGGALIWRSKLHSDGTMYENYYIMGYAVTPGCQMSYHLPMDTWELTNFADTLMQAPQWDGHTSNDVVERLTDYIKNGPKQG